MRVPFDVDQAGWGSVTGYDDWTLSGGYEPRYTLIHWGGLTDQVTGADEAKILRGWQRYHMGVKEMRDIAYNYAIGDSGTIYRLRGMNPNGSNKQSLLDPATGLPWNNVTVAVVWIGGQRDSDGPSEAAKDSMQRICDALALPVMAHSDMKATACPGADWRMWIVDYTPTEVEMPRLLFEEMIKALFRVDGGEFRGDPNYWIGKIDTPDDPEWQDFWLAYTRQWELML